MPREASITYDQVAQHAESIRAEGGKPTPRSIRDRHGSGSLGTIHRLFQQWDAKQAVAIETPLTLAPSVQRAILEFVRSELLAGRADLEGRLAQACSGAEDLSKENERQSILIQAQAETIERGRAEKAILEGRLSELETILDSARDEATRERLAAEVARTELAKAILRLESMPRLEAELSELRLECMAVDRRRQDAERDLAVSKSENQLLEKTRNELARGLEARLSETQDQLRAVVAQLREAQEERVKVTTELANVHASRAADGVLASERIGKLEGAVAVLKKTSELMTATPAAKSVAEDQSRLAPAARTHE